MQACIIDPRLLWLCDYIRSHTPIIIFPSITNIPRTSQFDKYIRNLPPIFPIPPNKANPISFPSIFTQRLYDASQKPLKPTSYHNLQPFFNKSRMKLYAHNRQKLVINRTRKPSPPQKMQMEVLNGLKLSALPFPLENKDTNIIRNNSSIFRKVSQNQVEKPTIVDYNLIRCRSISCLDRGSKLQSKLVPSLQKLYSHPQEDKQAPKSALQQTVHSTARDIILQYKQKSLLTTRNNNYNLSFETFLDLLLDFGQKIMQRTNTSENAITSDGNLTSKASLSFKIPQKIRQKCKIESIISINEYYKTKKQLSYHSGVINNHLAFQRATGEKQAFWKALEELDGQTISQENFTFLLDKVKYLKQQIYAQERKLKEVRHNIEESQVKIGEKNAQMMGVQEKTKKKKDYLQEIEMSIKDMEGFISRQPNRILQQQAEGYKQREQQLFDLAFILEQSTPDSFSTYIQECIMIPFESFKLTLSSFSNHHIAESDHYIISHEDMDSFKNSISAAYQSTISKLKVIIEGKASKIKNFVGIMRRLASYTIGKREYLTEINKKMAVVSVNTDKNMAKLEKALANMNASPEVVKSLSDLKELSSIMRSIYCEAEVFY